MDVKEAQEFLTRIGFGKVVGSVDGIAGPKFKQALTAFQTGFGYWDLTIDGKLGPKSAKAIVHSCGRKGTCTPNFQFKEFKSKGNGFILVHRELPRRLEILREVGGPISIISGYRDPAYNRKVGGAENSQHLYGFAADIPYNRKLTLQKVLSFGLFSGIGYKVINGKKLVRHVDLRHLSNKNTTGGTVKKPTIWSY